MNVVHVIAVGECSDVVVSGDGLLKLVECVLEYHVKYGSGVGVDLSEEEVGRSHENIAAKSGGVVGASQPVSVQVEKCILRTSLNEFRH